MKLPPVISKYRRSLTVLGTVLAGIAAAALLLALFVAGDIYEYQDTVDGVHLPEVDAIICLAGGKGRISAAGDLWYRYWELHQSEESPPKLPVLYISGMGPQANWNTLARQLRRGVLEVIQPENVLLETESFNTEANARWVDLYAYQNNWKRILLVTSPYHMKRARLIFDRIARQYQRTKPMGIETLSVYQDPFEQHEWRSSTHGVHVTLLEYSKWLFYRYFWKP